MRWTAPKDDLLQGMQAVSKALPSTSAEPMLLNVLIDAQAGGLQLFATNNRVSIRQGLDGDVTEPGAVAVPGSLFNELIQGLSTVDSDRVAIEADERHRVTIDCGRAHYEIGGYDPKGFPFIPPFEGGESFKIPSDDLRVMLRQVAITAGSGFAGQAFDEVAWVKEEDELVLISTDSVRLAIRRWKPAEGDVPNLDIRVPIQALQELGKVLGPDGETTVQVGDDAVAFHFGGTEFRSRLSEKAFPNYKQILPRSSSLTCEIETRRFADALKGTLPLAREMKQKVHLKFEEGQIEVLCVSPEIGQARQTLPAEVEGGPLELAFNARYLLDYLAVAGSDKIRFQATSSVHPAKLEPLGDDVRYTYILMPINL